MAGQDISAFEMFFVAADSAVCQDGLSSSDSCNVAVENLQSLDEAKGGAPDSSNLHHSPICMEGSVTKELFNVSCLNTPSVSVMDPRLILCAIIFSLGVIVFPIVVVAVWLVRHRRRHHTIAVAAEDSTNLIPLAFVFN